MQSSLMGSESTQSASKLRDKLSVLSLQGAPLRLPSICAKSSPCRPVARIPRAGDLPRRSLEGGSWLGPARIDSQKTVSGGTTQRFRARSGGQGALPKEQWQCHDGSFVETTGSSAVTPLPQRARPASPSPGSVGSPQHSSSPPSSLPARHSPLLPATSSAL